MSYGSLRDLKVYQLAFDQAMEIYQTSKKFPKEEQYALTDQIRRSSRAVCSNLGEGYSKRQYPAHFINKISDADMENTETKIWLEFAYQCNYLDDRIFKRLFDISESIGRILDYMMLHPEKFQRKNSPLK